MKLLVGSIQELQRILSPSYLCWQELHWKYYIKERSGGRVVEQRDFFCYYHQPVYAEALDCNLQYESMILNPGQNGWRGKGMRLSLPFFSLSVVSHFHSTPATPSKLSTHLVYTLHFPIWIHCNGFTSPSSCYAPAFLAHTYTHSLTHSLWLSLLSSHF